MCRKRLVLSLRWSGGRHLGIFGKTCHLHHESVWEPHLARAGDTGWDRVPLCLRQHPPGWVLICLCDLRCWGCLLRA